MSLASPAVNTVTPDSPICYDEVKDKETTNMFTSQANQNENLQFTNDLFISISQGLLLCEMNGFFTR